jgi:hypothetical protein
MPVGQSTHREVVAVMQQRPRLQLKVRNGGLLPVRDRRSEPVSWRVVAARELPLTELVRKVEGAGARGQAEEEPGAEHRLQISLQGQQGLGCSICKVRRDSRRGRRGVVRREAVRREVRREEVRRGGSRTARRIRSPEEARREIVITTVRKDGGVSGTTLPSRCT